MQFPRHILLRLAIAAAIWPASAGGAPIAQAPARTAPAAAAQAVVALPDRPGSLKFAIIGDFGTGDREQYQVGVQMAKLHQRFPFELVLTVGDNLYGSERPQDFRRKFEIPYKDVIDAGVKFYASLGNHDDSGTQSAYPGFNMGGERYYSVKAPRQSVRFFALDSTYLSPDQIKWLAEALKESGEDWKITFCHHPPYSSGSRHGSDLPLRKAVEPLFVQHNVSVVFTGHDHFYERIKPQKDVVYFVAGSGGKLAKGDIGRRSPLTAKGFDADYAFVAAEIFGDEMFFNAISRAGDVVDSGVITRRRPPN